jgi:hypothetical protein
MAKMDVFDCQDMPEDVKVYFFEHYGEGKSNDAYINVWLEGNCTATKEFLSLCDAECDPCQYREYDIVSKWIFEQGIDKESTDYVIVKRWW